MRWEREKEKGSRLGMRTVLLLARIGGYGPGVALTAAVATFHWLSSPRTRRFSATYLRHVGALDANAPFWKVCRGTHRHFLSFAINLYDRIWMWQGRMDMFEIERFGEDLMESLHGAVLVGAHVGSFDLMRVLSRESHLDVRAVMYTQAGAKFADLLKSISPDAVSDIFLLDGRIEQIFEMQALVQEGGILAVMADRSTPGRNRSREIEVPFLGAEATFPTQVWHLASLLECPVVTVSAVRTGWRRYEVRATRFSDRIVLPHARREAALREIVSRYAAVLEGTCRQAPYQWFNFLDFWKVPR